LPFPPYYTQTHERIKTYFNLALNEFDVFFNFWGISRTNPTGMPESTIRSHIKCISQCECVNFCGPLGGGLMMGGQLVGKGRSIAMQHVCVTFATSFEIHA